MIRCGELCKGCGGSCSRDYEDGIKLVGCPICGESGTDESGNPCPACENGSFRLDQCPRKYIGNELIEAVNLAGMCGGGDWPVAGGLLQQSAWFVSLKQHLDSDQAQIETEKMGKS